MYMTLCPEKESMWDKIQICHWQNLTGRSEREAEKSDDLFAIIIK